MCIEDWPVGIVPAIPVLSAAFRRTLTRVGSDLRLVTFENMFPLGLLCFATQVDDPSVPHSLLASGAAACAVTVLREWAPYLHCLDRTDGLSDCPDSSDDLSDCSDNSYDLMESFGGDPLTKAAAILCRVCEGGLDRLDLPAVVALGAVEAINSGIAVKDYDHHGSYIYDYNLYDDLTRALIALTTTVPSLIFTTTVPTLISTASLLLLARSVEVLLVGRAYPGLWQHAERPNAGIRFLAYVICHCDHDPAVALTLAATSECKMDGPCIQEAVDARVAWSPERAGWIHAVIAACLLQVGDSADTAELGSGRAVRARHNA